MLKVDDTVKLLKNDEYPLYVELGIACFVVFVVCLSCCCFGNYKKQKTIVEQKKEDLEENKNPENHKNIKND